MLRRVRLYIFREVREMKQNRKGFSLVELIVVLVIMAIIAALCAPNISAYVQAAKIQNYQTALNQFHMLDLLCLMA